MKKNECYYCGEQDCKVLPAIGEFIDISSWNTFGMIMDISPAIMGEVHAVNISLQENPDQHGDFRTFRLEPEDYEILS